MAGRDLYLLSRDTKLRLDEALRAREAEIFSRGQEAPPPKPVGDFTLSVLITGPGQEVRLSTQPLVTTTLPPAELHTLDLETPGDFLELSDGSGLEVGGPTGSIADALFDDTTLIFPCLFVYHDLEAVGTVNEWVSVGECWAYDPNGYGLGQGCVYDGKTVGYYLDVGLVETPAYGADDADCTSTIATTTTTGGDRTPCDGECVWHLDESTGELVRDSSTCGSGCGCPPPGFCPPDSGCGTFRTYCLRGYVPPAGPYYCGGYGTATTTTTSATTTTTPDPAPCGSGCDIKYVPDLVNPYVILFADCPGVATWTDERGTYYCGTCAPALPISCVVQHVPCQVLFVPFPPPIPCTGTCRWVWPDVDGLWWQFKEGDCASDVIGGCQCNPPSVAGTECNQSVYTPCFTPSAPTLPHGPPEGGGSDCVGSCVVRWDATNSRWHPLVFCSGFCGCGDPGYDGTTDCDLTFVPCVPGVTTTTATTTTTASCSSRGDCLVYCDPGGIYAYSFSCEFPPEPACHCTTDVTALLGLPCSPADHYTAFDCVSGSAPTTTTTATTTTTGGGTTTSATTTTTVAPTTTTATTTTTGAVIPCVGCPGGEYSCFQIDFGTDSGHDGCCASLFGVHQLFSDGACSWSEEDPGLCTGDGGPVDAAWNISLACFDIGDGNMQTEWHLTTSTSRGWSGAPLYVASLDQFDPSTGGAFNLVGGSCAFLAASVAVVPCP